MGLRRETRGWVWTVLMVFALLVAGCAGDGSDPLPAPFRGLPRSGVVGPAPAPAPLEPTLELPTAAANGAAATLTPRPRATRPTPTATRPAPSASELANLRAGPGTNYPIIGQAIAGQTLEVVARTEGRDWLQLTGGKWIFAELVQNAPDVPVAGAIPTVAPPTDTPVPTEQPPTATPAPTRPPVVEASGSCTVSEGVVNVRSGPGEGYSIAIILSMGTALNITGKTAAGDWLRVDTPFKASGWVYAPYCQ